MTLLADEAALGSKYYTEYETTVGWVSFVLVVVICCYTVLRMEVTDD